MIEAVRRYVGVDKCAWETAIGLDEVSKAEDVRWRDAVDAAELRGEAAPDLEAEWAEVWQLSRDLASQVCGALYKQAIGGGKNAVAAAKALLPVEGGAAWGTRGGGGPEAQEGEGLDEVALDRLSPAQRRRVAEIALAVRDGRDELEQILRDARAGR